MPCYGPEPTKEEDARYWEKQLRHNSPTAEAFCELCQAVDRQPGLTAAVIWSYAQAARMWWAEHKQRDKERIEQEFTQQRQDKDREELLKRLSAYEKQLLGLRD